MESGRLENESTASLCRRLAVTSRTGCLHLIGELPGGDLQADVYLREGRVYTATAPGGRARLGDRLVGGGYLSAEQLETALTAQQHHPAATRLGDVLVASGAVTREQLRTVIREQIVDSVAVPLGWSNGRWWFADGEAVAEDIPLGLGMQDTLMEASRRQGQIEVIQTHMGSMDTVVDFASGGSESKLSLKPDEWAMLTHIDGFASVADIADRAGYTTLEAARIIYGLLSAGVVIKVGAPPAAAEGGSPLPTRPMRTAERAASPSEGLPPPMRRRPPAPARSAALAPARSAAPAVAESATPAVAASADDGDDYLSRLEGLAQSGTSPWGPHCRRPSPTAPGVRCSRIWGPTTPSPTGCRGPRMRRSHRPTRPRANDAAVCSAASARADGADRHLAYLRPRHQAYLRPRHQRLGVHRLEAGPVLLDL
ncbi:hypothetical protein BH23ACT9_BH23ACT9_01980 [soil metagenome]